MKKFLFLSLLILANQMMAFAHASPNTMILVDVYSHRVEMDIHLPVPELDLSFGHNLMQDPAALLKRVRPELQDYVLAHIRSHSADGIPWKVEIDRMKMDKGFYLNTSNAYWEVIAHVILTPESDGTTGNFILDYDVIMHEVRNHVAIISIRNDWASGIDAEHPVEVGVIRVDIASDKIFPLIVTQSGNQWNGFTNMVRLGMEHIKEGTDHLLFLLVLLISAPLVAISNKWKAGGGTRYSLINILKIVTAFTIGHSITLLIGSMNWIQIPGQIIEVLIAFSILVTAVHAYRPIFPGREMLVAIGFGLIHGLAFADTLVNLQLDKWQMALSILGFNLGIEIMQLAVVVMIIPWLIILSRYEVYAIIRIFGSVIGGIAAMGWMAERVGEEPNFITRLMERSSEVAPWAIAIIAVVAIAYQFRNVGISTIRTLKGS